MSYVRWGIEGSNVYVFQHVSGWLECCGCEQNRHYSTDSLLAHLREHQDSGDHVPDFVFTELESDRDENDAWIAATAHIPPEPQS